MLTMGPDRDNARSRAAGANAGDADDNATPDPALDVTLDSTPHCKNVDAMARAAPRTARNNPDDRTSAPENLRTHNRGADPRAPTGLQLTPTHAPADVADNADAARCVADDHRQWPDNDGSP
jgi:hypothetical protein